MKVYLFRVKQSDSFIWPHSESVSCVEPYTLENLQTKHVLGGVVSYAIEAKGKEMGDNGPMREERTLEAHS